MKTLSRAVSSGLPGGHRGRSTTLRLALNKAEVQQECDAAPLEAWATAVWEGSASVKDLRDAWYQQLKQAGMHP